MHAPPPRTGQTTAHWPHEMHLEGASACVMTPGWRSRPRPCMPSTFMSYRTGSTDCNRWTGSQTRCCAWRQRGSGGKPHRQPASGNAHLHHVARRHAPAGEGDVAELHVHHLWPAAGRKQQAAAPPRREPFRSLVMPLATPPRAPAHRPHLRHFSKSTVMEAELESCHSWACASCSLSHSWLRQRASR